MLMTPRVIMDWESFKPYSTEAITITGDELGQTGWTIAFPFIDEYVCGGENLNDVGRYLAYDKRLFGEHEWWVFRGCLHVTIASADDDHEASRAQAIEILNRVNAYVAEKFARFKAYLEW